MQYIYSHLFFGPKMRCYSETLKYFYSLEKDKFPGNDFLRKNHIIYIVYFSECSKTEEKEIYIP